MKRLASVSLLVAFTLGLSAWVGSHRASAGETHSSTKISRSRALVLGGRLRCTATVTSKVQAGHSVSVKFTVRNVSKRPVKVFLGRGAAWLVVKAADGTTYDTRAAGYRGVPGGPVPIPTKLRPGASKSAGRVAVAVRWRGPLRITPGCEQKAMRQLHVAVLSPGPPTDESAAVSQVVAATGHLLDQCRPQTAGVPVDGQIDPPTSGSAPPMSAQCSVSIEPAGPFWVAQVLVLIPPGLTGVTVQQPYELFGPPYDVLSTPRIPPPYEAIAWQLVVTREGALSVAAATTDATNESSSGQMAPSWTWNGTAWVASGTATCGFHGWAWGGTFPTVDFISACPS